ncbi:MULTISPECIES: 6-carboxytetrahydropterin synthase QueD [Fusobacterium]|uniref:6-carboxytetrahydropterin synthase QueD n=1 Tax=Fusobacterium TaxID=848 RepID=UPI001F41FCBE|nr:MULTISPECIES: 6-carboxytetrahydropterin synthase QueD [Fusobacterium]MCF2612408.1 6-carboxytetrahydropterin synthase QueD [Fusobacterium perfoetens]MDY2981687.1 6-carboxytetrahydropterin synthase QueD [Fusobacterium sp.]
MYSLVSEASFDSAHFLAQYEGKCRNIHGHRWTVKVEIFGEKLQENGSKREMLIDFGELKSELKKLVDFYDHSLIIEKNTMRKITLNALKEDGFRIIEVEFRPTAENFAKNFYDYFIEKGFSVKSISVYETPNNCAIYSEMM